MNLIRAILLKIEADQSYLDLNGDGYSSDDIVYNAHLLLEAGLVDGASTSPSSRGVPKRIHIERLTWSGHDFLDAMKDESIWNQAQETVLKPMGGIAFDVLLEWLKVHTRAKLGLP